MEGELESVHKVAVASSKVGGTDASDEGEDTVNSISSLLSAVTMVVGKASVHLLFWECS